jgi:sec-independent protein translocase protein TatA
VIGDILQPTHLLFILVIGLLVLGPKRLPEAGRAIGSGLRNFRAGVNGEGLAGPADEASLTNALPTAGDDRHVSKPAR